MSVAAPERRKLPSSEHPQAAISTPLPTGQPKILFEPKALRH